MGHTKLDDQLGDSSLMACPSDTFKVFIYMLSRCGPDGIARTSPPGISSHCYLPLDVVRKAIKTLEGPDPDSRSMADEGRRIRRADGGFFIINYWKFRERKLSMAPAAIRQRKHRGTIGKAQSPLQGNVPSLTEAEAESHANVTRCHKEGGVFFDGSAWIGLTPDVLTSLSLKFPVRDIPMELEKMAEWIKAEDHPERNNPEDDRTEFIERWLKRPIWESQRREET